MPETTSETLLQNLLDAITRRDEAALADATQALAQTAATDLPTLQRALDMLAYHGRSAAVAALLEAAWPALHASDDVSVIRARPALAARATDHLIFAYLQQADTADAADPQLLARLRAFFDIDAAGLARYVTTLTGETHTSWQVSDFDPAAQEDARAAAHNLSTLLIECLAYLRQQEGVAYSKGNLLRQQLPAYFSARRTGQLAPRRDFTDLLRGNRPLPDFGQAQEPPHPLCPDRATLEVYLSRLLHFAKPQPYPAAALFELTPAWLRFLVARGLLTNTQQEATLQALRGMETEMAAFWRENSSDPALATAAERWPSLAS